MAKTTNPIRCSICSQPIKEEGYLGMDQIYPDEYIPVDELNYHLRCFYRAMGIYYVVAHRTMPPIVYYEIEKRHLGGDIINLAHLCGPEIEADAIGLFG